MPLATFAYERGTQAILIPLGPTSAAQQQVGQAAPTGSNVVAIVPTVARGQLPVYVGILVRSTGTVTGGTVQLLGSFDGVNFFNLGATITAPAAGGGVLTTVTPPLPVRFLAASVTTFTGGGSVEVSFVF